MAQATPETWVSYPHGDQEWPQGSLAPSQNGSGEAYGAKMISYLHRLSAILFYLLGGSFFLAYLLMKNDLTPFAKWWLNTADLPLALVAMLYGGISLYRSVKPRNGESTSLLLTIFLPLIVIFAALLLMNFWPLLSANI